jgi:predicted transcriptional regulator
MRTWYYMVFGGKLFRDCSVLVQIAGPHAPLSAALDPRGVSQTLVGYPLDMGTNVKIEVDERTADALKARAAELGMSLSELLAELAALDSEPVVVEPDEIVELDRRWKKVEAGQQTVPHEHVVRWLRTWGTPRFRPWRGQ